MQIYVTVELSNGRMKVMGEIDVPENWDQMTESEQFDLVRSVALKATR